jgi:hypothetical protein
LQIAWGKGKARSHNAGSDFPNSCPDRYYPLNDAILKTGQQLAQHPRPHKSVVINLPLGNLDLQIFDRPGTPPHTRALPVSQPHSTRATISAMIQPSSRRHQFTMNPHKP